MYKLTVNNDTTQDIKNIANGTYDPLVGFLRGDDFKSVLDNMRLRSGDIWSIPIVLDINEDEYQKIKDESAVELVDSGDNPLAILENIEIYDYDKKEYAHKVFGTTDSEHPGVADIMNKGRYLLGGDVVLLPGNKDELSQNYYSPKELKNIFKERKWSRVAAFQTRNIPHRSHEFLQRHALGQVDGLLIQPVIGRKKAGDFKDELIISAYSKLIDEFYPENKCILSVLPLKMHYAGPREAVHHALIRRNFGCSHIIIGRDHAGVGSYYRPYAAHEIFDDFDQNELGIEIMKLGDVAHCRECGGLAFVDDCEHGVDSHTTLSGSRIREMIKNKESLPEELIRPEILEIILEYREPFV